MPSNQLYQTMASWWNLVYFFLVNSIFLNKEEWDFLISILPTTKQAAMILIALQALTLEVAPHFKSSSCSHTTTQ